MGKIIDGVLVTPLKIINVDGGNVLHAMKATDKGYVGFGEVYFSTIQHNLVKAWKRHTEMTLNLVVPFGEIRFVIFDDRKTSSSDGAYFEVILSRKNYCRLTVPPMVWIGFQGLADGTSILLNTANIPHNPSESDTKIVEEIEFDWRR